MKKQPKHRLAASSLAPLSFNFPLFVYGRLTDPGLLERLLGRAPRMDPAVIRGIKRVEKKGTAFFTLKADQQGEVAGCFLHGITPEELRILDKYEEVDRGLYKRRPLAVKLIIEAYI